ncbi:unnamed protein product, partial [Allacma fusca]
MEFPSGAVLILLILLVGHSRTDTTSKPDSFYQMVTGKSKAQLLESGEYVLRSAFGQNNPSNSGTGTSGKASGVESQSEGTRSYLPMTSAVRAGQDANSIRFFLFTPT